MKILKILIEISSFFQFLVNCIDFRYCTDVLTKEDAIKLLEEKKVGCRERVDELKKSGYRAYTTAPG